MDTTAPGIRIFKPRPSYIWRSTLLIAAATLLVVVILLLMGNVLPGAVIISAGIVFFSLALTLFGLAIFFRQMINSIRYELSPSTLTLIGGPVRYDIPLADIRRVHIRDINPGVSNRPLRRANGVNTPGLALGNVSYKDPGVVKMCGTSAFQRITLLETDEQLYGITPADETAFFNALSEKGVPIDPQP